VRLEQTAEGDARRENNSCRVLNTSPSSYLELCENKESAPFATPIPTPETSVGDLIKAIEGVITRSRTPEKNDEKSIMGLPTVSNDPIIL